MAPLCSSTATSRVGVHSQGYSHPAPCALSLAGHPVPHTDPLWVLPLVYRSPRVGAVEAMDEVPGTQGRLLSSGLCSLPMSTPGWPWSAYRGPRHVGGGGCPGPSHTVWLFPLTAIHGNSIRLCPGYESCHPALGPGALTSKRLPCRAAHTGGPPH